MSNDTASTPPNPPPLTPWRRYLYALLEFAEKHTGKSAAGLFGFGVLVKNNIPFSVSIFAIAGFFFCWYILKELRGPSKNPLLWWILLLYVIIAAPLASGISWWCELPQLAKTLTLHNINTDDWDKFLGTPNLKGTPVLDLMWPPVIEAKFEKEKLYGFLFQIGHNEYGMRFTGGDFSLYPSKEVEIDKNLYWTQFGNPGVRYVTSDYHSIEQEVPALLPVFRFKATQARRYLFKYEIRGFAWDVDGKHATPIKLPGRFVVDLHPATGKHNSTLRNSP